MKSVHTNLANKIEPNGKVILQRPRSVKGRRKAVRGRKCSSASKISSRKLFQLDVIKSAVYLFNVFALTIIIVCILVEF